jgi:hypothetical protein
MSCVISFRSNQSVLFVANFLINEYVAEETAGSDTSLLFYISHVDVMMMKIMMLTITLNLRNTVDNVNQVLQLELI